MLQHTVQIFSEFALLNKTLVANNRYCIHYVLCTIYSSSLDTLYFNTSLNAGSFFVDRKLSSEL
jgi:hypothetical protein